MLKRSILVMAVAMSTAGLAGCGNTEGFVPVTGKVLYRGEPAKGAVVYFHREASPGAPNEPVHYGTVEDDGRFVLTSDDMGDGARPGPYIVLVEWRDNSGAPVEVKTKKGKVQQVKRSRIGLGPDRLKGRYLDITKPLLHAEVKAGSDPLAPFELTD
jgi:hypothetical protein